MTIDAEDLFVRHFLGILTPEQTERDRALDPLEAARRRQLGDVLRRPGRPLDDRRGVRRAAARRRPAGRRAHARGRGARSATSAASSARASSRACGCRCSRCGRGTTCPALPPEQILLPARAPLSIYSFGCWARQTLVALSIARRSSRASRVPFGIDELRTGVDDRRRRSSRGRGCSRALDRGLHRYERQPVAPLRRRALRAAERWIVERQEADGSWGGIQPPWVWSIIALHALGYPLDHPVIVTRARRARQLHDRGRRTAAGSRRASRRSGTPRWRCSRCSTRASRRRTTRSSRGARLARRPRGPRARRLVGAAAGSRAGRLPVRVRERQLPRRRRHRRRRARAAARRDRRRRRGRPRRRVVARACSRATAAGPRSTSTTRAACRRSCRSATSARSPIRRAPTSPRTWSRCSRTRAGPDDAETRRGIEWLLREQERDGSWFGRWGANHVYGTGAAVPALAAARSRATTRASAPRVGWLERVQNDDGGLGEDLRSYRDDALARPRRVDRVADGVGAARASTPRARRGPAVERAVRWLVETQRADGSWDEP